MRVHLSGCGAPGVRCLHAPADGERSDADVAASRAGSTSPPIATRCVERFRNPALPHRTQQIAMDGSQKLPQRLLGTVRDNLAAGRSIDLAALAVAGWMRYASGRDESGREIKVSDPLAAEFARVAAEHRGDPAALAKGLLALRAVFGDDLPRDARFTEPVTRWLQELFARGAAQTVAHATQESASAHVVEGKTMILLSLNPDRLFPPETGPARDRASPLRDGQGPADRQPARPHRSAVVRRQRAVRQRGRAVHHAGSLRVPDALQPGRAPRGAGHPGAPAAAHGRERRARRSGAASRATIICSAARRRGSGSTTRSTRCSASASGSSAESADRLFDHINACLAKPEFRPRALFERFNIEVIATTESPLDPLAHHAKIRASGWKGRVVTAYRPDPVVDPEFDGFAAERAAPRRDLGRGHRDLARLPRRASQPPRILQDDGRDLDRPRPSDGADLRSRQRRMRDAASRRRSSGTRRARPRPRRSAGRCSPRWRG